MGVPFFLNEACLSDANSLSLGRHTKLFGRKKIEFQIWIIFLRAIKKFDMFLKNYIKSPWIKIKIIIIVMTWVSFIKSCFRNASALFSTGRLACSSRRRACSRAAVYSYLTLQANGKTFTATVLANATYYRCTHFSKSLLRIPTKLCLHE